MIRRYHLMPEGMFARAVEGRDLYTSVVVVRGDEHAHVYLAGQVACLPSGELVGKGDMRAQIRQVCECIKAGLEFVGAGFGDVVRTVTYTTDIEEYFRCMDVRFEYFTSPPPTSTLLGVGRLASPDFLVEIEAEAVLETERLRVS